MTFVTLRAFGRKRHRACLICRGRGAGSTARMYKRADFRLWRNRA